MGKRIKGVVKDCFPYLKKGKEATFTTQSHDEAWETLAWLEHERKVTNARVESTPGEREYLIIFTKNE